MRHLAPLLQHIKRFCRALGSKITQVAAKMSHFAPAALVQHARQAFFQSIHHQAPRGWHGAHQMVELPLDGGEIIKNVGVIELQVVQHRGAGAVVDELAALVEKRGVVLVGLDHEQGPGLACHLRAQAGRNAKIQRHTAHQKARLQSGAFQNPCQHGRGGGFAVGARHGQHMPALQHVLGQPLGAADVGRARIQNGLHQRELG